MGADCEECGVREYRVRLGWMMAGLLTADLAEVAEADILDLVGLRGNGEV